MDEIGLSGIMFFVFATIAFVSALMVVVKKNPVSAAFSLILVLFSFAGIYALIGAHTMAALQILVYAGAIMVLFVFVIMLLNQGEVETMADENLESTSLGFKLGAGLVSAAFSTLLVIAFRSLSSIQPKGELTAQKMEASGGNLLVMSESLFKNYVFHFELISLLILGAVISTVALAKRSQGKPNESTRLK